MKDLLAVSLVAVLLSIPSAVFAEASWYGSIRTGVESNDENDTGVVDFDSRWGIQGSSEVSEGLTAIYRYERSIDSSDASEPDGRLSYVGLSGGFGTLTIGQVWGASYNHFGSIVDQALIYGAPYSHFSRVVDQLLDPFVDYGLPGDTGLRFADAVSYSVSIGNVSLQVDAIMDQPKGKSVDAFNFGATLDGVMETGSIAIAHRKKPDVFNQDVSRYISTSSFIAGNYAVGDMTVFLGYSQDSWKDNDTDCAPTIVGEPSLCDVKSKTKTTYAGVHGGVGDNGVNYVFTMRNVKFTLYQYEDDDEFSNTPADFVAKSEKGTPWTLGLSRSLGGGATLNFEHGDPGEGGKASSTAVWLQVDF